MLVTKQMSSGPREYFGIYFGLWWVDGHYGCQERRFAGYEGAVSVPVGDRLLPG